MSQTTDFIRELIEAANTIEVVLPVERRRLIERGIATVKAQRELLQLNGNVAAMEAPAMQDMPNLAELAGRNEVIEVVVGAGMLTLADEIRRLRVLGQASRAR